ncbi:MAG: LacI family DNA-binding transcriptional regulator [Hungatella hathewayi]
MQEKKKKATIKDVAARANTSITTVSRVLSGSDYPVKEELKTAIIDARRGVKLQEICLASCFAEAETAR